MEYVYGPVPSRRLGFSLGTLNREKEVLFIMHGFKMFSLAKS
jgi:hypothetical protein